MIPAKLVMELRNETNQPMMKCKQALEASNGDKEGAIDYLRKQGTSLRARFAGREFDSGLMGMRASGRMGVLVCVGCQTDFVAKSDVFGALVNEITDLAWKNGALSTFDAVTEKSIGILEDAISKLRENIAIVEIKNIIADGYQNVIGYNHGNVAGLVAGYGTDQVLKNIVLHVVSSDPTPLCISRNQIDPSVVAKESQIISCLPDVVAKPEAIRPKVIEGKLNRFFRENVLLEQELLVGGEKGETVDQYLTRNNASVSEFVKVRV